MPPQLLVVTQDLRTINRLALDPARSVVVAAVAGSGKTWLLVSRILRLLLDGIAPSEILAITFTRKATQEMATRLREWLRLLATESEPSVREFLRAREVPEARLDEAVARARGLYEHFLTAQPAITIATFHGWFLQLLRRAPLEAGALGAVNLVESTGSLMDEAWQRFGARVQQEPEGPLAHALDALFSRYGLDSTRKLLRNFVAHRAEWWAYTRGRENPVEWALARMAAGLDDPLGDAAQSAFHDEALKRDLAEFTMLLSHNTSTDKAAAVDYASAMASGDAEFWFDVASLLVLKSEGTPRARKPSAAQAKRLGSARETRLLELHENLGARFFILFQRRADQVCYRANQAALPCGVMLIETYQALKDERQAIDYGDIEWRAFALVSVSAYAEYMHHKLDARYRHVLLDEFQDTNPLQWLTLKSWFSAAAAAASPPIVFLVGDPKQSIYRFRGAESRLFDLASKVLQEEFAASVVAQQESRRCAPAVLEVVNQLFSAEADYPGYDTHTAHAEKPGRVEVLPLVQKTERRRTASHPMLPLRNPLQQAFEEDEDARRELEAQQLVARIREIVGVWQVVDETGAAPTRPARYQDIMILVKRRTHLAIYEHALRAGRVPFLTSRQGGLLGTLEAQDMIALLRFLVSPFEDLNLAHALRSPVFAADDEDLIAITREPGRTWWERLSRLGDTIFASAALRRARTLLGRWLAQSDSLPVHDQLDRIYFEGDVVRRYEQSVPAPMRGPVRANLHAFMQRALDTDAGRYPSLPRFLNELDDLTDAAAQEAPDEGIVGDASDAVRILTIHGAKGLEKPIVWLLSTGAGADPAEAYGTMIDWPARLDAPAHFSVCTRKAEHSSPQRNLCVEEERLARREDLNLLYVAMTRAQQALIVSGYDGQGREGSWYDKVRDAVSAAAGGERSQDDSTQPVSYGAELAATGLTKGAPAALEQSAGDARLSRRLEVGMRKPADASRGVRHGTHVHDLLDRLSAAARPGAVPLIDDERESLHRALGLPAQDFAQAWESARRVLDDPALARFFDARRYIRADNEVAYINAAGEVRRIDRLVEFEDEVWVLDYKSGGAPDSALLAQYEAQMREYAGAVSAMVTGKRVRAMLLFTSGPHHVLPVTANQ